MKKLVLSLLTIVSFALGSTAQTDYGTLALNHQLAIGMTYGDVLTALGNPQRTVTSCYSRPGVMAECWTAMENGWVVCFENGRVVSFNQVNSSDH